MLSRTNRTLASVLCAVSTIASACSTPGSSRLPAADLVHPPKPVPTIEILASEAASISYDNAVEAWGEAAALKLGRLCRFARDAQHVKGLDCPKP